MPELAEVEFFRRVWSKAEGKRVSKVSASFDKRIFRDIPNVDFFTKFKGSILNHSLRNGKKLCFIFNRDLWLGLHMGMTGRLLYINKKVKLPKYAYLVISLEDKSRLIFQDPRLFGRVLFSKSKSKPEWWSSCQDELISNTYTFEKMDAFLAQKGRRSIKPVLLIQDGFPGIGNWMADEILWRSRIIPTARVISLNRNVRMTLFYTIKEVCFDALRVIADGWKKPPNSWLFNHRWTNGGICPETDEPLVRERISGRTACWSPRWQIHGS